MRGEARFGWAGLGRAVAVTAVLTSAFWILVGAWLFRGHLGPHEASPSTESGSTATGQGEGRQGLVSGLGKGTSRLSVDDGRKLTIPVTGVTQSELVDTFSQARAAGARRHDAIDIMAPEGRLVVAAASGTLEKLFHSEEGGNTVYVRSPDRKRTYYYAHLARYAPGLREGAAVRRGEPIGAVGHTGNADEAAPHLHFAVWDADPARGWYQDGPAINPYDLLAGKPRR